MLKKRVWQAIVLFIPAISLLSYAGDPDRLGTVYKVYPNHTYILQNAFQQEIEIFESELLEEARLFGEQALLPEVWKTYEGKPAPKRELYVYKVIGGGADSTVYSVGDTGAGLLMPALVMKINIIQNAERLQDFNNLLVIDRDLPVHPFVDKLIDSHLALENERSYQLYDRHSVDLEHLLKHHPKNRLDKQVAMVLIHQILQGLAHMHLNNWVHGDLRLDNFMLTRLFDGIKIIDLIRARQVGEEGEEFADELYQLASLYFKMRAGLQYDLLPKRGPRGAPETLVRNRLCEELGECNDSDEVDFIVFMLMPPDPVEQNSLSGFLENNAFMKRARLLEVSGEGALSAPLSR